MASRPDDQLCVRRVMHRFTRAAGLGGQDHIAQVETRCHGRLPFVVRSDLTDPNPLSQSRDGQTRTDHA